MKTPDPAVLEAPPGVSVETPEHIGFLDAATRNVLRVVDFFPAFFSLGRLCRFCNRRAKRLGDYAAGTIVIQENRFLAGRIEGFLSADERLPAGSKILVGLAAGAGLFTHLARSGKRRA